MSAISDASIAIIDSRNTAAYDGTNTSTKFLGHITTAVHHDYMNNLNLLSDTYFLKSRSDIEAYLGSDGLNILGNNLGHITYCGKGIMSAYNWFVLTYLIGKDDVKVYDASWSEWGIIPIHDPDNSNTYITNVNK